MKTVYALMCTSVLLVVIAQLTGCAVNIVVAPNATFAVDSLNQADDNRTTTQYNET